MTTINKKITSTLIFLALAIAFILPLSGALTLVTPIPDKTWAEDATETINLSTFFSSDATSFSASSVPNITISFAGSVATLTPAANFFGTGNVVFTAINDTGNRTDSNTVLLTVISVNDAPVITSTAGTTATENVQYTYNMAATDVEGDALTFSLTTPPAGMIIDPSSGLITWLPKNNGTFPVTASVFDGADTDTESWNLTVSVGLRLEISDLDVKVDGDTDKNLDDGDTISDDAVPGSTIVLKIEITNLFTDDEDLEIEDIEVIVTIFDIDDGDDLEEEADSFDLKADKDERLTFTFEVPLLVDEDSYDILIEIEGEDEEGRTHEFEWELTLDVDKKKHDLLINQAELATSTLECRRTTSLFVEVINLGSEDEDEVVIDIRSDELGINFRAVDVELDEGSDEDSVFKEVYQITVPDEQEAGTYQITVKAYYDTTKLKDTETVELVVQDCGAVVDEEEDTGIDVVTEEEEEDEVELIIPEEKFTDSPTYIALLVLAILLILGGLVFAIGTALKK